MKKTILIVVILAIIIVGVAFLVNKNTKENNTNLNVSDIVLSDENGSSALNVIDITSNDHGCKIAKSECNTCSWKTPYDEAGACTLAFCEDEEYVCQEYFTDEDVIDISSNDHGCKQAKSQCNVCNWQSSSDQGAACTRAFCENEKYYCVEYFQ